MRVGREKASQWRGGPFPFSISTSEGGYRPHIWAGADGEGYDEEMRISPKVPCGVRLKFYIWDAPVEMYLEEGQAPSMDFVIKSRWNDSRSWWFMHHQETNIEPGWFYINGVDAYENTLQQIKEKREEKLVQKKEQFAEAKARAIETGFSETQIARLIKAGRNTKKTILYLNLSTSLVVEKKYSREEVVKSIYGLQGENPATIENYVFLLAHASQIKKSSLQRIQARAYAWGYINKLIPGYGVGRFDEAMDAISLALANEVAFQENSEGDLATKLREAGL